MTDALRAEIRRLWGGEASSRRTGTVDDWQSEMVRVVSAAAVCANDQVARLNTLTLPLIGGNVHAQRSNPSMAAQRFIDQVRSDYRRVSPQVGLREADRWRRSEEGAAVLREAGVQSQSVAVLAVGEILDKGQHDQDFYERWIDVRDVSEDALDGLAASVFGDVLGPIVLSYLGRPHVLPYLWRRPHDREARPAWGPDLNSEAGRRWVDAFIQAGANCLLDAWVRAARIAGAPARAPR